MPDVAMITCDRLAACLMALIRRTAAEASSVTSLCMAQQHFSWLVHCGFTHGAPSWMTQVQVEADQINSTHQVPSDHARDPHEEGPATCHCETINHLLKSEAAMLRADIAGAVAAPLRVK